MRKLSLIIPISLLGLVASIPAQAQWVSFANETATRMPVGAGQNTAALSTTDPEEKDYAWGDFNNDGWVDLAVARKRPFTFAGGKRNVLFMNVNGVLLDRTQQYASTSINVPPSELTYAANMNPPQAGTTQGFLDLTNNRDIVAIDVNNDGWLDLVTATTISDVTGDTPGATAPYMLPRFLGHPRVYINQGEVNGVWQGFVYDYSRIPQLFSKNNVATHPRFCSLAAGDINNDGYADLYFGDYDTGEVGPTEAAASDFDNKLLINQGASNPGFFTDESVARMGALFNYGGTVGSKNLLYTTFGAASAIADMNGDGLKDVIKQTSLVPPQHVATLANSLITPGVWSAGLYKIQYSLSSYFFSVGDLNNDGNLDIVHADDNDERYQLWTSNSGSNPNYSTTVIAGANDGFASNVVIADLNNDGWRDVLICDVDVDGFGCARRMHICQNQGNAPNVTIANSTVGGITNTNLQGTHDVAVFDVNNDGWLDMVIGRCSTTAVWINAGAPSLSFSYPNGRPDVLSPGKPTTLVVQMTASSGTPTAVSPRLFYSVNGAAFVSVAATSLGGNLYEVVIPADLCATSVRYYLWGQISGGGTFTDPPRPIGGNLPAFYYSAYAATSSQPLLSEDFEGAGAGWTVANDPSLSNGGWALVTPNGTWNEGVRAAPNVAAGGSKCFVTGNAAAGAGPLANNVDGGPTHLVSPTLNLDGSNAKIDFSYWFYTTTPGPITDGRGTGSPGAGDVLTVSVSNDNGATWTVAGTFKGPRLAEPNLHPGESNSWKNASIVVGDSVAPTAQVKVRFSAHDVGPIGIVEAGIDNVVVTKAVCALPCAADTNGDTIVNVNDLLAVINNWGACAGCAADVTGDGTVNVNDLLAVINAWGKCP